MALISSSQEQNQRQFVHRNESSQSQCEYCMLEKMEDPFQCQCETTTVSYISHATQLSNGIPIQNASVSTKPPESVSFSSDGFIGSELLLMKNLILLSFTSSLVMGIVQTLITIDRYIYGPWTYIGFAVAFMLSALSVYYTQTFVTRFGPNKILVLSIVSVVFFVLVHYSSNFILFQLGTLVFALFVGPFYATQLEFMSTFISNLIYLTPTIKRYQEERYQRLFHLLLFCPSRIVGHLVYVVLFVFLYRSSNTTDNHHYHHHHHHYQQNQSKVIYNDPSSGVKPICIRLFRQQYCDQALYYIFSFHRFQPSLNDVLHVLTFEVNFITILTTVFILLSLLILMVVMCLLHRIKYHQIQDPLERSYLSSSIRNIMFRTFHDNHLRFLLPMAFFVGFEQGFFMSDYNKLYVSCALGLEAIGLIMLTKGFVHLATTLLVHEFIRHIQRPVVLFAGAIFQLAVLVILCLWRPNDDLPLYYVITMCWAISNAILETLLFTNVLRTFCSDEWKYAFLTLYSMSYLGFGAAFGMSEFICLYIKLYVLILVLIVALIPMKICELRLSKFEKILGPGSTSRI